MDIDVRDERGQRRDEGETTGGRPAPTQAPSSGTGPGFTVPGYTILDELGRGGCAIVYRARQEVVGRVVALKVLTRLLDDGLVRRFERERRALGALAPHPNIVVVHDAGFTPTGEAFFALELMSGGSLSDRMRGHRTLAVADALSAGVAVADALAAAHGAGLLHRDVKPGNVLVDHLGVCKLSDFGIAAFQGDAGSVTGGMAGTVAHTAPEVLSGQPASVASDVYSLGSTLYALLTGEAPFVRGTDESFLASALRAWTESAPDLRARGVPDELAAVIEATMAKEPEGRPASAAAVAASLRDCQRALGLPVSTSALGVGVAVEATATVVGGEIGPIDPPTPAPPWPPLPAAAGRPDGWRHEDTSVLAVQAGWLPIPSLDGLSDRDHAEPADAPDDRAGGRRGRTGVAVLVAAAVAAALVLTLLVRSTTDDGDGPSATTAAAALSPSPTAAPTAPPTVPPTTPAPSGPRVVATIPVGAAAFGIDSSDGAVWVTVNDPPRLVELDARTRAVVTTVPLPTSPEGVAVTADAVWVTDFQGGTLWRVDPVTGAVVASIPVGQGPTDLTVTDRGVFVVLLTGQGIARVDPATNTVAQTIRTPEPMTVIQADATGDLWVAGVSKTVRRLGPDGRFGKPIQLPGPATAVAAGPDAVWVAAAVADDQGRVVRIDPTTGQATATLTVGTSPNGLAVGADAVWVTGTADDTAWRIDPLPDRPQVKGTVDVPGAPLGIAATTDAVWVAVRDGGAVAVITGT
jgi:sugar lactone lactonase YvrE